MYAYTWDPETGGLLLNSSPLQFSKEPRPVYWRELDLLGFDKYWQYPHDDSAPIMWAEANNYIYRGRHVAKLVGGSLRSAPTIEIIEQIQEPLKLVNIDSMVRKNDTILNILCQDTIKSIYNDYNKHKNKIDFFYVAFSGGKDSLVVLDLVQKSLPHTSFKVIFGDTKMEFPDTYEAIEDTKKMCNELGIEFFTASSHMNPETSWHNFGPPATVNRWCCSVHKTAPQILLIRELIKKPNFRGFAFIGVRRAESIARSEYDEISEGKKHRGQISCNPILDWNSAELYLYIYSNNLKLNQAYLRGNRRVGCLVCPRAAERNEYIAKECYTENFDFLTNIIKGTYSNRFVEKSRLEEFIANGGWKARKNGQDINVKVPYEEIVNKDKILIHITSPRTSWREWIKTIGIIIKDTNPYLIKRDDDIYEFEIYETCEELNVSIDAQIFRKDPTFIKLFKSVFRKTATCVQCRVCEADCPFGNLHMIDGTVHVDASCHHCSLCHKVDTGCLVYKSLEKPKSLTKMAQKSLNCYSHFAPKMEWLEQFFKYKNDFKNQHTLGSNMFDFFKRFLRDSELVISPDLSLSQFAILIDSLSLENENVWSLMFVNLSYTPQINWVVKTLNFGEIYSADYLKSQLIEDGAKESWVNDVCSSLNRLATLPFRNVGFLKTEINRTKLVSVTRQPYHDVDSRVILYSLYKYAEGCGDFKQFTMSRLFDKNIDSDGVSPIRIFGLDETEMEKILKSLSINYPEYINVTFTHDLDNITLKEEKSSADVLSLF